jgi:hypothetical protein
MKLARPRSFLGARRILFAAAIVLTAGDCTLNVDVGGPNVIIKGNGDNQTAPTNTQLTEAFTVLVANQFGQSLENVTVSWTILTGGGSLTVTSDKTDAGGVASAKYTTGPAAGTATIQAKVSGVPPVVFAVTVT